jgi:hypothetical protein
MALLVVTLGMRHENHSEDRLPRGNGMKWQTIKTGLWSAVGGAVVWWIVLGVGFGWMPPGSAERLGTERVQAALLDVRAPICVAKFKLDSENGQMIEALKEANSWAQDDFVAERGWATMPGDEKPEAGVAAECARRILASRSL